MITIGNVKGAPIKVCSPGWIVLRKTWDGSYWQPCLSGVGYTREEAVWKWNRLMYGETTSNPFEDEREYAYTTMRKRGEALAVRALPQLAIKGMDY